jgi:hypothetical protein
MVGGIANILVGSQAGRWSDKMALRLSPLQALLTTLVPDHQRGSLMSLVVSIG